MIFAECKPDCALVCRLRSDPGQKVEHSFGKSSVLNKLVRRSGFPNYENSIGMIDEDPDSNQPKTIRDFTEKAYLRDCDIRILYYRFLNNHVLVLCPELEEWIIAASHEARIEMADFGLPNNPEKLHEIINLNIDKFEILVDALRGNSRRIDVLESCLHGHYF